MSITSVLLLSLLCIGAAKTHELENKNSDFSNFYANAFTDILRNAIVYKQKSYLKQMIADNFLFSACTKNYNRRRDSQIPSMTHFYNFQRRSLI